jgi:type IV pilus assembly protein PilW
MQQHIHNMRHPPRQPLGMTLIETMVAMAISSILILGSITIYSQARANFRTAENIARLQESMRYAAGTLEEDIRLAGFWGRTNQAALISENPAVNITCDGNNVTDWALDHDNLTPAVAASDDNYDLPCPAGGAARDNSDVLIVRHASPSQQTVPNANRVQVITSGNGGYFLSNGVPLQGAIDPQEEQIYDAVVNAYYVSNSSRNDVNMPSLRRHSLVGEIMQDQEVISGVENLQVQFGVDQNNDGNVDSYLDSDNAAINNDQILSVRLWMLVRGDADETGQGFTDTKRYPTPDADGFVITPDDGTNYPSSHRRYEITKTIVLKNRLY